MQIRLFFHKHKYELLLGALIQHLFAAILLVDLDFYTRIIWPANMIIIGVASVGVFIEKGRWTNLVRNVLFVFLVSLPLLLPQFPHSLPFMIVVSTYYFLYFLFILWEIMKFLIRPGYINTDIISAAGCGYFLLLEIAVFLMQSLYYGNPSYFTGIDASGPATIYTDLVYFCTITITSIGFGDILPHSHITKLLTAFLGIVGQFYSVVLVGILISKFSSTDSNK